MEKIMVQKHQVVLHDDLDGSPAHQTVQFGLDGHHYEIDLKDEHAHQLRDAMGRFVAAGRKVTPTRGPGRPAGRRTSVRRVGTPDRERLAAIREWARANGHQVADRGRIPAQIVADYDAAQAHH